MFRDLWGCTWFRYHYLCSSLLYLNFTLLSIHQLFISLFSHLPPLSLSQDALLPLLLPLKDCRCQSLVSFISPVFLIPPPSTLLPPRPQLSNTFLFLFNPSLLFHLPLFHLMWHCSFALFLLIFIFSFASFTKLPLQSLSLTLSLCSVRGQAELTTECCD